MSKRVRTNYPGVFYREADRIGGKGLEKVYYVVFKRNGITLEEKVGRQYTDDMTPARASLIRAELIEGRRLTRKEIKEKEEAKRAAEQDRWTVDRLWSEYIANKVLKGFFQDESRYRLYIKPSFGEKEPKEITPIDIDRLRLKRMKGMAPQSIKLTLALLRRIIRFGSDRGMCPGLSFKLEMPKVNNEKTEDLSPEQISALIKAINEDFDIQIANLMRMALFTGMRRGELLRLKWEHVDFRRGFIRLVDPKGGKDASIPLNDAAREVLENHPKTSEYVFPGRNGGKRTEVRRGINRIKERAGLPADFRPLHGLRHTYASMLASSGQVDLYTLQKLLTHKSPAMTQRYAHLRDEALKQASNLVGDIVDRAIAGVEGDKDKVVRLKK